MGRMKIHRLVWLPLCVYGQGACGKNRATTTCAAHSNDRLKNYSGDISQTQDGEECAPWRNPRKANSWKRIEGEDGSFKRVAGNHCRNGRGGARSIPSRNKPWCYTNKANSEWKYCKIPLCSLPAYLRTCDVQKNFLHNPKLAQYRMEFDSESCILKDQFTQPQIDRFLASVPPSTLKVSPWIDCGFTYRGKMSEAEIFDEDKGSSQQLTCREWNDKRQPTINFEVNQRGKFCHFPDYQQTGPQCGKDQMPWCYVEEGVEQYLQQNGKVDTKYGYCQIKDCKCGTTGLYHINFYSEKAQLPHNLTHLLGDKEADKFMDLIESWNENKPFVEASNACTRWKNVNEDKKVNDRLVEEERKAELERIEVEKKECKETFSRPECEKECPQYDEFDDTCDQGLKPLLDAEIQGRIINGVKFAPGQTPWIVALDEKRGCGSEWSQFCGGTLIHPQWVLTAAHCIQGRHIKNPSKVKIHAGMSDIDADKHDENSVNCAGQTREAEKIVMHENYNTGGAFANDIALIKLDEPFWINNMVHYMCLPPPGWTPQNNQACMISGWGLHNGDVGKEVRTSKNRKKFKDARMALVRHYEKDECECVLNEADKYSMTVGEERKISDKQICFGHKTVDTCSGDSGGPLICKAPADSEHDFYLTGIVSYGINSVRKVRQPDGSIEEIPMKCGKKDVPGIYTKVSEYLPWIYSNMVTNN